MTRTKMKKLVASVFVGSLMALGSFALSTSPASAQTEMEEPQKAEPQSVEKIEAESATAEITKIDKKKRTVTLKAQDGEAIELQVPEEHAAKLDTLKKGDTVRVDYVRAIALEMAKQGETAQEKLSVTEVEKRLPEGAAVGQEVNATVEVSKVDTQKNEVTVKGPKGMERTIKVVDPAMQQRLSELKKGDKVQVRFVEAAAIQLERAG